MDIEDILEVNEKEQWLETRDSSSANRRRNATERRSKANSYIEIDDNPFINVISEASSNRNNVDKPKRKSALWSEELSNTTESESRNSSARLHKKSSSFDNETEVVPMIPDLEDVINEDFIKHTADAPKNADNRLISYKDLKQDVETSAAFASLDGIELTALTKTLIAPSELQEEDIHWNWDHLISEVACQMQQDTQLIDD
ncbi:intraflagellar transport protein 43-like protein [Leptotrombidium deliense]|uniref:Intraflagellar transport protein 43-like protein n=1 Tax=Leptotrombidium deliense TaxID=299467 RepID=A0A443S6J9_9ACAR|nr:intraflagellar transport protein 43-like protein [Leptotrombidium deliense]